MNTRKAIGILGAAVIFVFWLLVDAFLFPSLLETVDYPTYELTVYGSWVVIIIIVLGILSISEAIPNPMR